MSYSWVKQCDRGLRSAGLITVVMFGVAGCSFDWLPVKETPLQSADAPIVSSSEYYYRLGLKQAADGPDQDLVAARKSFLHAAEKGHGDAQYLLALAYFNGKGGSVRHQKGLSWLEQAARRGQADAQFRLGDIYLNGREVDTEEAWGVQWIARAADQGHAEAQYQLGIAYATGLGWPADLPAAWSWLSLARKAGYDSAAPLVTALEVRMSAEQLAEGRRLMSSWRQTGKESGLPRGQVRFIQHGLNHLGFDSGQADGWAGPVTRQAISQFRLEQKVSGSGGSINTALVSALRQALM